jgi:anti-anti-sigma factor
MDPVTFRESETGEYGGPTCPVCGSNVQFGRSADVPCLSCGHRVWFNWDLTNRRLAIELGGPGIVTEQNMMRLLSRIDTALGSNRCDEVLLDFGPLTHLTSPAIAELVILRKRLNTTGGRFQLRVHRPELRDVFRITRLDSLFPIEDRSRNSGRG